MSKDTSKFSLEKAGEMIRPHLKVLPFKPFREYISILNNPTVEIEGVNRHLRFYDGAIRAPLSFSVKDRVFAFPILVNSGRSLDGKVDHIYIEQFLLKLSEMGGTYGLWYFQRSWFRPVSPHEESYFDCWKSEINSLSGKDDEFYAVVKPAEDFSIVFWSAIDEWTKGSISSRESMIASVARLRSDAIEQLLLISRRTGSPSSDTKNH
ncbi:MAG: hypothetical protein PHG25_02025 [Candidatus Pacebacteria bacterium]|nr:hypothetical protein [Candidatus Paceibacterota bacterium]